MSHPFGDLLSQYLHRKHGLNQSKLAAGILQAPAIITDMCYGRRLRGPQARERVLDIIDWLWQAGVLQQLDEANALLVVAGMAPLQADVTQEASLLAKLTSPLKAPLSITGTVPPNQPKTIPAQVTPTQLTQRALRSNLPTHRTPFIGREREQRQIAEILADPHCGLLTIVGTGGTGKTRLALQAVGKQQADFADGVWFVALAPLTSARDLAATCLEVLSVEQQRQLTPDVQLIHYLSHKQLLLILDNFEHLLPDTDLIQAILNQAPNIKLLVTSRERLKLQAERLLPISGLAFPRKPPTTVLEDDLADLQLSSAIHLFVERARHLNANFALTTTNAAAIVQICQAVDGMPLAIELAVGWTRLLTCQEIAARISADFEFLNSAWRDLPPRHQSLSAVFAHSWSLLSGPEQVVLPQLAIFRGGFGVEAASVVASASLSLLSELVDKSWLQVTDKGRFDMHELIRQFVAKKGEATRTTALPGNTTLGDIFARHSRYYAALLHAQEPFLHSAQQREVLQRLLVEADNIRQGWHWAVEHGEVETIAKYLKSWQWLGEVRSWDRDMMHLFGKAGDQLKKWMQQCKQETSATNLAQVKLLLARLLHAQARHGLNLDWPTEVETLCQESLAYWPEHEIAGHYSYEQSHIKIVLGYAWYEQGRYAESQAICCIACQECASNGDQHGLKLALRALGFNAYTQGEFDEAQRYFQQSIAVDDQLGEQVGKVSVLCMLAEIACNQGDYERSEQLAQTVYQLSETFGIIFYKICSYNNLGYTAFFRGELEQAKQYYAMGLTLSLEINADFLHLLMKRWLGNIAYHQHDYGRSRQFFEESLAIARSIYRQPDTAIALTGLGKVTCAEGEWQTAHQYLQQAFYILQKNRAIPDLLDVLVAFSQLWVQQENFEEAAQLLLFADQHPSLAPLSRQSIAQMLTQLQEYLPAEHFVLLQRRGAAMSLEEVIQWVDRLLLSGAKDNEYVLAGDRG